MTLSPLGVNAHIPYIRNWPRFISRMQALNPRHLTACIDSDNDIPKVEALRYQLPNTEIVGRVVVKDTDGAFHLKPQAQGDNREWIASPTDFLNRWGKLARGGSLYALNEPGTGYDAGKADEVERITRLVKWTCETINLATAQNISLTVLNLAVGHPGLNAAQDQWDARFDDVLRLLSKHRNLHRLGVHEYKPDAGRIGRLVAMFNRCKTLGIDPLRVAITEAGWDSAPGEAGRNGYRSRGIGGPEFARQLIHLCEGIYRQYLDSGVLLGVDVFSYGNSGGWAAFDTEEDSGFWETLLDWQYVPTPKVATKPIPVPTPVAAPATNAPPAATPVITQPVGVETKPTEAAATEKPADDLAAKSRAERVRALAIQLADLMRQQCVILEQLAVEIGQIGTEQT